MVNSLPVLVEREQRIAILIRPIVCQIDHESDVRVAATRCVGRVGDTRGAYVAPVFASVPMKVIGRLFDHIVRMRVEMLPIHAPIARTGHEVPQMTDDRIDDERLAVVVVVKPPRVGGPVGDDFKHLSSWVVAPDAAVDALPL